MDVQPTSFEGLGVYAEHARGVLVRAAGIEKHVERAEQIRSVGRCTDQWPEDGVLPLLHVAPLAQIEDLNRFLLRVSA